MQKGQKVEKSENIPFDTNLGPMTGSHIVDHLTWCSYAANRGYGMTHEQLQKLSPSFTDAMDKKYNELKKSQQ